jgi:hypothetical protein
MKEIVLKAGDKVRISLDMGELDTEGNTTGKVIEIPESFVTHFSVDMHRGGNKFTLNLELSAVESCG